MVAVPVQQGCHKTSTFTLLRTPAAKKTHLCILLHRQRVRPAVNADGHLPCTAKVCEDGHIVVTRHLAAVLGVGGNADGVSAPIVSVGWQSAHQAHQAYAGLQVGWRLRVAAGAAPVRQPQPLPGCCCRLLPACCERRRVELWLASAAAATAGSPQQDVLRLDVQVGEPSAVHVVGAGAHLPSSCGGGRCLRQLARSCQLWLQASCYWAAHHTHARKLPKPL